MAVADQAQRPALPLEAQGGRPRVDDVLPHRVADAAVEHLHVLARAAGHPARASEAICVSARTVRDHSAASRASWANMSMSITPATTRSWFPARQTAARSSTISMHRTGSAP